MDDEIDEMEPRPPSGIRRNFTMRHNAARQVAVNFMPSRQLPYQTLRLRRSNSEHNALLEENAQSVDAPDAADKQAAIIVREMEQHKELMEDNPEAEELRRAALRDLPQGLTMKRNIRQKLSNSVSLRSRRRPISVWKRFRYRISFAWERGKDRFREIIFSVELWYEAIRSIEGHFGSAVGSYFYFLRWLFVMNLLMTVFVVSFVVVPQFLHDDSRNVTLASGFLDFISGKGSYEDSLLFYGHYHDGEISARPALNYNMPFAYFFTMVCLYLLVFAVLCYRTAYSYRRNFIETGGGLSHAFANKVFCGWDFGIATGQAAALNANSLYNEFKELLNEQTKRPVKVSFCSRLGQYLANTAVTVVVVASIVAAELGLWRLLGSRPLTPHWELAVSATVTLVVTLCPLLFNFIVKLEYYRPRTAVYVTLLRTWLLDIGTLLLLLVYWARSDTQCWETSLGQETHRLVLLDAVVSLFVLPVVEFTRAFFYKLNGWGGPPEFNIAYNSLTLIYNQGVVWLGVIFSPPLAAAVAIKFLLLFYVKKLCAMRACQPATKVWRASQTQTVMYMLVTLSLFTALFALGSLFFRMPSVQCGPFVSFSRPYSVLAKALRLSPDGPAAAALTFFTRPGPIAFLMLALCVWVYYTRARALAQQSMAALLRHMLVLQARDKDFLLSAIAKVSNGEWLYSPKREEQGDSHTWKYVNEVRKPSNAGYQLAGCRLSRGPPAERPGSAGGSRDGDTDSSFSWQGSTNRLNDIHLVHGDRKWI